MQAKLEFDLEAQAQKMKYQWNINIIDSDGWKLRMDNYLLREGSRTKLFKSLNLIFLVKLFYMLISLCFSTSGAEDFQAIIEERWEELRSKPSNMEQACLIPQPSRNSWGDTREFNKVSLVSQIIGYKPRTNNKNDAKCMDKYLREAPESDLVITKLGKVKDYLPVHTPLLDYLVMDTEGPT